MKRFATIAAICFTAMAFVGCKNATEDYGLKAKNWICERTDHFLCADEARHTLYYFEDKSSMGYPYFTAVNLVDMSTSTIESITCKESNETFNFNVLDGLALPADKGHNGSTSFVTVVEDDDLPRNNQQVAIIFDTHGVAHKKMCQGTYVMAHNNALVSCVHANGGSISAVDVFDLAGNKLPTKAYEGTIAKQSVVVEIVEKDGVIAGSYYYTKFGPGKHRIWIYGHVDKDRNFEIEGFNNTRYNCEDWEGTFKNGVFEAEIFVNHTYRSYDFTLTEKK